MRCTRSAADLIKKLLRAAQNVLELRQLQEVLLQRLLVGVDLLQLVLQLLKRGLEERDVEGEQSLSNQQSCVETEESPPCQSCPWGKEPRGSLPYPRSGCRPF